MYTTRGDGRGVSPVFNNMMYPYKDWYNTDYQDQYLSESKDMSSVVISNTIKKANKNRGTTGKFNRRRQGGRGRGDTSSVLIRDESSIQIAYKTNDEGYPLDDLDDTYMEPLKYYGRGFNCKTMSPTKD